MAFNLDSILGNKVLKWTPAGIVHQLLGKALPGVQQYADNAINSFFNKTTGAGLTGAEKEANEYTAMREDTQAQRAVQDYQAAGLNPAMMYQSGAGGDYASASAQGVAGSGSFGDIVNAMTLPLQIEQLKANIINTRERSKNLEQERARILEQTKVLHEQINEVKSRTDLNDTQQATIMEAGKYIDLREQAALRKTDAEINLTNATRRRIDALLEGEKMLQAKSLEDFLYKWKKIEAEIKELSARSKMESRDLEDYALNHMNTGIVADLLRAWREANLDKDGDSYRDEQ